MGTNSVTMSREQLTSLMQEVASNAVKEALSTAKSTVKPVKVIKPTYDVRIADNRMMIDIDLSGNSGQKSASLKSDVLCHIGSGMRPMPYKLGASGELIILDSSPANWKEAFGSILVYVSRLDR